MVAAEPIALARRRLNDSPTDGRWSDDTMLQFLSTACQQLIRDILFPTCQLTSSTVPNFQEYQLPEIIAPGPVYLQGRLVIIKSKATLEGRQTGTWDQTGFGPIPAIGSAGPSGNLGKFAPKWSILTPVAFPEAGALNAWQWPAPDTLPAQHGQRPEGYIEGGYLGFVPAPSTGPVVINGVAIPNIDCRFILAPDPVTDLNQRLWFPSRCASLLAWLMCVDCTYSDETQIAADRRNFALAQYQQQRKEVRTDLQVFKEAEAPAGIKFDTGRRYWRRGGYRVGYR